MEQEFYTNKMPKDCNHCPFYQWDKFGQPCRLAGDDYDGYYGRGDNVPDNAVCPLKNIAEHDVEVTKQVCKDILDYVTKKTEVQHV